LKETQKETCLNCLHRRVSAKPAEKRRLCFCAKGKKEARHREPFRLAKKVCEEFENTGGNFMLPALRGVEE
jgi:hypothetical protein